jgi:uncharacterized repeat protein (TIGR02543 family)
MATINIEDLTTINKDEAGVWTSTSCGINFPYDGVITAGDPCSGNSSIIYQDDNNNCFQCVGYSRTEVRTLKQGTTTVYVKCYVSFDENGGSSVSNRYVYFGTDGTNSRTYGEYASLPTPTRSGYTFDGWFDSETSNNGTGTQITNTTVVPSTIGLNKTLYAKWTSSAPTQWTYIGTGTQSYNSTTSAQYTSAPFCPSSSVQISLATTQMGNFSPGNYSSGHIFRVRVGAGTGFPDTFCSYRYYRAD